MLTLVDLLFVYVVAHYVFIGDVGRGIQGLQGSRVRITVGGRHRNGAAGCA